MNPEIRKRWREALLSGKYKQGLDKLNSPGLGGTREYCCLGVLCELAVQDLIVEKGMALSGTATYDEDALYLPPSVQSWAELDFNPVSTTGGVRLSELNDAGWTFERIAEALPE